MKRWDLAAFAGMLLPASAVIGFYIYIGFFNRMLGDDYCTMYQGQHLGFLRSIWFWYKTWHGGFSASATDWFISFWGSGAFSFYVLVFLLVWLAFTILVVRKALQIRGYPRTGFFFILLLGVLQIFTTLGISPNISQSLFWWGGVRAYLSPLILTMLYFALYCHFITLALNSAQTTLGLLASFGLAFFIGGFSETFTPTFVVFLIGTAGFRGRSIKFDIKDVSFLFLIVGFFGSLLALLFMILAPGNSARQAYFPVSPSIFTVLSIAFMGFLTFLFDIFKSPFMLMTIVGAILGSVWLGMRLNHDSPVAAPSIRLAFIALATGLILAFGSFPPAAYGISDVPPPRALITSAFILASCLLISGFFFGEWLITRVKGKPSLPAVFLFLACSLIIFSSWSAFQTLSSMSVEHISFAQKWDRVETQIKDAKQSGLERVNIPSMENWAGVEYPGDNLKYWPNLCYSKFYDIPVLAPPIDW